MIGDLRFAMRALRRRPAFSVVAVATFAVGIGGLAAIASIVRGVLLTPLPFPGSNRLATYWLTAPRKGLGEVDLTEALFCYHRDHTRSLADLAAYSTDGVNLSGTGEPERVTAANVTYNFFRVLGVQPLLGREFLAHEDTPGNNHVAILSQGFWKRSFGGNPAVVGQAINLNGTPTTVVGVMPASADFPHRPDIWLPIGIDPQRSSYWYLRTLGRLRAGRTVDDLRRDIAALTDGFAVERPEAKLDVSEPAMIVAMPLTQSIVGDFRAPLFLLLASVGGVLLIACANIATLSLARAVGRGREMAVRQCLGASRYHLAAQLSIESLVLALIGSGVGVAGAIWILAAVRQWFGDQVPRLDQVHVDPMALGFVAAVATACGVLFGLAPAWYGSRVEMQDALKAGGRATAKGAGHWNNGFVVAQFALSLILLVATGLLLRSFARLSSVEPGFRPEHVLAARMQVESRAYDTRGAVLSLYGALLERTAALPGVQAVGLTSHVPFSRGNPQDEFIVDGQTPEHGQPIPVTAERFVSPGYLRAMETPMLAGRDFQSSDDSTAPAVAIVNETLARRYWPGGDPLGKRLHFGKDLAHNPWMTVVGVVADTKQTSLADDPAFEVYQPIAQTVQADVVLVVRTAGRPTAMTAGIREVVRRLDPAIPIFDVHTMDAAIGQSLGTRRLTSITLTAFGGIGLMLAAIGVYGVMSLAVTSRIREFGVRLAIGAQPAAVVRQVLRRGLGLATFGITVGLAACVWLTRFLSALLFGATPIDPTIFALVAALLALVALAACWAPAYRASRADPVSVLREAE